MMKRRQQTDFRTGLLLGWLMLILLPMPVRPLEHTTGAGTGVGGAYHVMASGTDAIFYNPANLAGYDSVRFGVQFIGFNTILGNNAFSVRDYLRYNGAYLDDAAKNKIMQLLPAAGFVLHGRIGFQPIAIRYRAFAFSTGLIAAVEGSIAEDLFSLMLFGNQVDYEYRFQPASARAIMLAHYSLSGAKSFAIKKTLRQVSVGINLNYLRGYFYGRSEQMYVRALTEFTAIRADGAAYFRHAEGGQGFSFDLGLTGEITDHWRAAVIIENIAAQVRWHSQAEVLRSNFILEDTNVDRIFQQEQEWENVVVHQDTTYRIASFTTRIPMVVTLGWMFKSGKTAAAAEYTVAAETSALTSDRGRLALGVQYQLLRFLPLRVGLALGGNTRFLASYGMGLHCKAFCWDMGIQQIGGFLPMNWRGLGFASSFAVNF